MSYFALLLSCPRPCSGERTRAVDGAHVEYFRGVRNPIGIKIGPSSSPDAVVSVVRALWPDPGASPGRISLITRLGAGSVATVLPAIAAAVASACLPVVWLCDPMHGNTTSTVTGHKTRHYDAVVNEVLATSRVLAAAGQRLGGIHLEVTAEDVTECVGGPQAVPHHDVPLRYSTYCDPRLNRCQSLALAVVIADFMAARRDGSGSRRVVCDRCAARLGVRCGGGGGGTWIDGVDDCDAVDAACRNGCDGNGDSDRSSGSGCGGGAKCVCPPCS